LLFIFLTLLDLFRSTLGLSWPEFMVELFFPQESLFLSKTESFFGLALSVAKEPSLPLLILLFRPLSAFFWLMLVRWDRSYVALVRVFGVYMNGDIMLKFF